MKLFCTLTGLLLIFQSLHPAPKSLMNIKIDSATRTITVKNQSSGGDIYFIDFGDGVQEKSTTAVDYVHTYAQPGVYQVCMITMLASITTNSQETLADTLCKVVEIPDVSCTAQFDVLTNGLSFQLFDRSIGDYKKTYWYLEDLKQWVNKSTVSYQVSQPGYYTVRLRIEGKYCSSEKDTILVLRPDSQTCVANFSFTQIDNYTVAFQNLSSGQWTHIQWYFGDGNYSTDSEPTHVYSHPGNFKVRLILLDSLRNISSEHMAFVKIANETLDYLPDFEFISHPDTNQVQFLNRSVAIKACTYLWSFGDGYLSTDSAPQHTYATAGKYTVCLTQFTDKKRYTVCKSIIAGSEDAPLTFSSIITGKRKVAFTANWLTVPEMVTWDFGDGSTSNELNPSHRYQYDSIYLVTLKARWSSRYEEVYQIVNLSSNPGKLAVRFAALTSQLKASTKRIRYRGALTGDVSRIRFEWQFGDGNVDTLNLLPDYTYATDSVYTVCLKVYNDLTNDSTVYCQQVRVGNVAVGFPEHITPLWITQRNGFVQINCKFQVPDQIHIALYDMSGRKIRNVYSGYTPEGNQIYRFSCNKGAYIIRLWGKNHTAIEKIIVF